MVLEQASGERERWRVLVEQNLPVLLAFFRYLGASSTTVEDLAQETFCRAFRSLHRYDSSRPFVTWLVTIGRHVFYDEVKKNHAQLPLPEVVPDGPGPLPDELAEAAVSVEELLGRLSDPDRFLVEMRIIQDLPFAEIADLTGEGETTLRVRFHRLLKRLRLAAEERSRHVP